MFNGLLKSEIKKAETIANKFYSRKDCKVTATSWKHNPDSSFVDVDCEICYGYDGEAADHYVTVSCFLLDRRRSFASVK